jgi:uncharacterized protein
MNFSYKFRRQAAVALSLCVAVLSAACSNGNKPLTPQPADTLYRLRVAGIPVQVEVALSQAEQQRGLMHRESLAPDRGMFFPYPTPQRMSFWMANTLIHLDIGFFTEDGVLREVHTMFAGDTSATRSVRDDLRFALEVPDGWFRRQGVRPGAQLNLDDVAAAIRGRGGDPLDYGIRR